MEISHKDIQTKKIPAFTVLKNGSILKNIFLLRKQSSVDKSPQNQESGEEVLLVGRHPHCHITLEHPSISRYHLRIHSNPSSQILSVVDLSSVHGTWVSGRRIEPGVHIVLKEGDTVQMGGSSRVYELHWVPRTQACDVDAQFVPAVHTIKEEVVDEKHEEYSSNGDLECSDLSSSNKIHDSPLKALDPLTSYFGSDTEVEHSRPLKTCDENGDIFASGSIQAPLVVSETTSATQVFDGLNDSEDWLMTDCSKSSCDDDTEVEDSSPWKTGNGNGELFTTVCIKAPLVALEDTSETEISDCLNKSEDKLNWLMTDCSKSSCDDVTEVEDSSPWKTGNGNGELFTTVCIQAPLVALEDTSETEISDCVNKSEDKLNCLRDNLSNEFDQIRHETIKDDQVSIDLFNAIETPEKDALDQNIARSNETDIQAQLVASEDTSETEISDCLNKSEDKLNWSRDNVSNEFDQIGHGTIKDDQVSIDLFNAIGTPEKDALDQSIARSNETDNHSENQQKDNGSDEIRDVGCEFEQMNQSKMMDESASTVLYDGVDLGVKFESIDHEVNGSDEIRDVGCKFEQMNQTEMMDESASMVLYDGVDMDVKYESIDHEMMKKESVFVFLPDMADMDEDKTFTPDMSKAKEVHMNLPSAQKLPALVKLFDSLDGKELEFYTPDKENKNPNACSVKSLSKRAVNPVVFGEKDIFGFSQNLFATDEGMCTEQEVDPFVNCEEVLTVSSEKESKSIELIVEGSCNSINYPQTVQKVVNSSQNLAKKSWTMVVDTNSLLDPKSLKHLKLLEGIKRTRLFVPKIVVRELMEIKSQDNFFNRSSKKASLALRWIDECMMNTRWWIHMDDDETVHSSTAVAQVLAIALRLREEITDQKIIILGDNLTLKIKAMAEGIMCEAAEEFRESLVNPFSERFMWVGSSARGLTWSCVDDDDDIVRQKYHGFGFNRSHRFKGLKILACVTTSQLVS